MQGLQRTALGALIVSCLGLGPAGAQERVEIIQGAAGGDAIQLPGMMGSRQFKTGTGRIRGRVISAETGNPLRRAQVRISGQEVAPRAALTDADGRFEFRDLPAGRVALNASKSGYVSVQYGQTRPFESGRPIELADKQVVENADISMPRGSVVSGRILDEFGEPVPDVMVNALRQTWVGGRRRLAPVGGRIAQTNDLGQFRIYGLPPGDYYISATLRTGMEIMPMEMMTGPVAGPTASTPTSGYAPTYFPGTPNVADAQKISLAVGQEAQSTDFALLPVRLAKVSGVVVNSDGKPVEGAMINVMPASRSGETGMFFPGGGARTNKDGAFTINGVAPGDYTLQARSVQVVTTSDAGGATMVFRTTIGGGGDADSEFGSLPLSVTGEDIANVVVLTSKGGTASGRLTFEDGATPSGTGTIRLSAMPTEIDGPVMGGSPSTQVKADGTFELKGVSGMRMIRAMNTPPGLTLKSVRLNGVDVTDTGIDFKAGESVSGIEVTLTARTTTVTGGVIGSDGAPVKEYTVVIFSDDPDQWRLPLTRWVSGTRPDQEGRFKVQNLPPGTYHAIAVDYLQQGEWGDPDLLERLRIKGKRFTLSEGGSETLELKLSDSY